MSLVIHMPAEQLALNLNADDLAVLALALAMYRDETEKYAYIAARHPVPGRAAMWAGRSRVAGAILARLSGSEA